MIQVSWKEPKKPNGIITQYNLAYFKHADGSLDSSQKIYITNPKELTKNIGSLTPNTVYCIYLQAATKAGTGIWSKEFIHKTDPLRKLLI